VERPKALSSAYKKGLAPAPRDRLSEPEKAGNRQASVSGTEAFHLEFRVLRAASCFYR
jgi:hypothetical protein